MDTELGRRLRDLAVDAPPTLPADGLWDRAVRRRRQRVAAATAALAVLVVAVGGLGLHAYDGRHQPVPAVTPTGVGHLPRTLHEPQPWSAGTADTGPPGPLAAVGFTYRKRPTGIVGMVTYEGLYGVSAVDGTARFLDLPTSLNRSMPGEFAQVALSPDGRKIAYGRSAPTNTLLEGAGQVLGWDVYDTVTGRTRQLRDPASPVLDGSNLAFSSDSRYLLTSSAPDRSKRDPAVPAALAFSFVAWDVETGARQVVEKPGEKWLPNTGSGPDGIVWSRDNTTYTFDPATRTTTTLRTEHDPVSASYAPTGTGFAYTGATLTTDGIDAPWHLYAGPDPEHLQRVKDVDDVGTILGWRDAEHVVVALTDVDYAVVDVTDGSVQRGRIDGVNLATPTLASDLWAHDLVPGTRTPGPDSDPREPWRTGGVAALFAAAVAFVVVRRRRGWRRG